MAKSVASAVKLMVLPIAVSLAMSGCGGQKAGPSKSSGVKMQQQGSEGAGQVPNKELQYRLDNHRKMRQHEEDQRQKQLQEDKKTYEKMKTEQVEIIKAREAEQKRSYEPDKGSSADESGAGSGAQTGGQSKAQSKGQAKDQTGDKNQKKKQDNTDEASSSS